MKLKDARKLLIEIRDIDEKLVSGLMLGKITQREGLLPWSLYGCLEDVES